MCLSPPAHFHLQQPCVSALSPPSTLFLFFFKHTATTKIYTSSLHDALPISSRRRHTRFKCDWSSDVWRLLLEMGWDHVWTTVILELRRPPSSYTREASCRE